MHTPFLPVQSSNSVPAQPAKACAAAVASDGVDFQRALTRQIEQRQAQSRASPAPAPAPAPARNAAPAPHKPAAAPAKAPAQQQARPATPAAAQPQPKAAQAPAGAQKPAQADKPGADKDVEQDTGAAPASAAPVAPQAPADAAAAKPAGAAEDAYNGPVADMLALVASLNLNIAPPPSTTVGDSAAGGAGAALSASLLPAGEGLPAEAQPKPGAAASAFAAIADAAKAGAATAAPGSSAAAAAADPALSAAQLAAGAAQSPQAGEPGAAQLAAMKTRDGLPELQLLREPLHEAATLAAAPVQQASLQIAEAATSVPSAVLRGQVGTPAWNQELGQKIVWMVAGAEQSATLTLNPPDLGPLQVVLRVSNDQLDATFTSAQPEVRQALEAALPRLREMMSATGLELANASVSAGLSNQQNGANGEARMGRGGGGNGGNGGGEAGGGTPERGTAAPRRVAEGMVDTFA